LGFGSIEPQVRIAEVAAMAHSLSEVVGAVQTGTTVWQEGEEGRWELLGVVLRADLASAPGDIPAALYVVDAQRQARLFVDLDEDAGMLAFSANREAVDRHDETLSLTEAAATLDVDLPSAPTSGERDARTATPAGWETTALQDWQSAAYPDWETALVTRGLPRIDVSDGVRGGAPALIRITIRDTCRYCFHSDHLPSPPPCGHCGCPNPPPLSASSPSTP
jgi:hypothetical protein